MKKITKTILYAITAFIFINLASCKKLSSFDYPPATGSAFDIISADNNFSNFKYAVDKTGLGDLLKGKDEYTIFVPTNAAFINAGYPLATLQTMLSADVAIIVKNHIVAGKIDIKTLGNKQVETTLGGLVITVQNIGNLSYVNGGDILNVNQTISNGFLNTTNTVLVSKPTLTDAVNGNSQLTFLAAAIARASTGSTNFTNLLSGNTPYTLFAPSNNAFIDGGYASIAAINLVAPDVLGNILKYHLIAGTKFTTAFDSVPVIAYNGNPVYFDNTPRVVTLATTIATNVSLWYANGINFGNNTPSNLVAANGVMHVIPRLLPTPVVTNTFDRIKADANLTMFLALIQKAGTADPVWNFAALLSDPAKSYTVFAVNNTGLTAAGYANVAAINAENPAVLAAILKLHMINKRLNNINIADNATSIPVTTPNVVTTNGLLNIIGTVLKP